MTDFLVNFGSNAALVITQMRQLEAQALRTQAVINQTTAASARTAAAGGGGPAALGGLSAAAVGSVSPQVDRLTRSLGGLQSQMRAMASLGIAPTLQQTRKEMTLLQQIAAAGGPIFGRFNSGASAAAAAVNGQLNPAAAQSAKELLQQRAALDSTSQAFQRHVGRIQETVLVYAALAAAAAGVTSAVSLASTIDTESRRLEAVLNFNPQQGRDFVSGIFETAVGTATPVEELLAESDFVASAFSDVTDAADRERQSLELLNRVGQVTTVTQRDTATEAENLIAIMKLGGLTVDQLGTTLGQVTVAGNNSSTAISAILEALQLSLPAAKLAGVTIEQLIALTGLFRQETQRSGSVIGSTFSTLFQTITNEKAQNNIKEITDGLVDVRDEAGNLRPALEILLQVRALIDSGALDPAKLQDIFKAFAPPLNPGAAKDIAIIFDLLDQLPASLREVESASAGALDQLVDKLNAALGPQFKILIEETKKAFFDLFGQDIINSGQALIDLMRGLGSLLGALPPDLLRAAGGFLALLAAVKSITFVGGALFSLLGIRGIGGALAAAEGAALAAGRGFGFMTSMAAGLQLVLSRVLPLLVAMAAIDFAQQVGDQQAGLKGQIGASTVGLDREGLLALRGRLTDQLTPGSKGSTNTNPARLEDAIALFTSDPALNEGIAEIDKLLANLEEKGPGATVAVEDLGAAFQGTGDITKDITDAYTEQADSLEELFKQYLEGGNAVANMTREQRIAAEASQLQEATLQAQASDLATLSERLREGKITAEEFAQGQQIVAQAAELAAQLVAVAGDKLGEYPVFAAAAAEGNEALTEKVYEMIVASGGSINAIGGLIQQLSNLAAANAGVAASLAANPLIVRIAVQKVDSRTFAANPELSAARRYAQNAISSGADAQKQIDAILDSITNLVSGFGTGTAAFGNLPKISGSGGGGSTKAPKALPAPQLFDLGDLPRDQLEKALKLAFQLQASIPGATAAAKNQTLNIIKDAAFLKQVRGLDDQLLRKTIERLIDVEQARLDLERQRAQFLQNVVVNQGPLSSLITQPSTFGANGGFLSGTGLNGPSGGVITINIGTISGQSLTKEQIAKLVYEAFTKALAQGSRLP